MRIRFPPAWLLLPLALLTDCGKPPRTSVVLVTIDTLRADALGCYGSRSTRTPCADRFATEGTLFLEAQSVCPMTLVSHATILTGLLPPQHGLRDNDPPRPLPPAGKRSFPTLAESLSGAGYATAAFVSSAVVDARTGLAAGFSVYDGPEGSPMGARGYAERPGGDTVARARAWIESAPPPFFVWVHLFDPHEPYAAPEAFRHGAGPGAPEAYSEEVEYADFCLGTLLDTLSAMGIADRTLTILASDHGEGLGEHGERYHGLLLYQSTLRVPLIVRWPGHVPAGAARGDVVSLSQITATVLDAVGVEGAPGRSLLVPSPPEETVVSESLYGYRWMNWAQLFAARSGSAKLLRGPEPLLFELKADPFEAAPRSEAPPALVAAMERYRALPALAETTGPPLRELAGFPYASGPGRGRLALIPWAENARLPWADPAVEDRIHTIADRVEAGEGPGFAGELKNLEERCPDNPSIPFLRAKISAAQGEWAAAAVSYSRAFALGLRDGVALGLWIESLIRVDDIDGADRVAREHLREAPANCGLLLLLAVIRSRQGKAAEAAALLDEADSLAVGTDQQDQVLRFRRELRLEK